MKPQSAAVFKADDNCLTTKMGAEHESPDDTPSARCARNGRAPEVWAGFGCGEGSESCARGGVGRASQRSEMAASAAAAQMCELRPRAVDFVSRAIKVIDSRHLRRSVGCLTTLIKPIAMPTLDSDDWLRMLLAPSLSFSLPQSRLFGWPPKH
jgi:hypothetical protein